MLSSSDIKSLANLLKIEDEDSSSEDDLPKTSYTKMGPGDVGSAKRRVVVRAGGCGDSSPSAPVDAKAIWDLSEVPEVPASNDILWDPRKRPDYTTTYRQNLAPQDVYLQMSNKTPGTASCESMIVTISLEGETKEGIDCEVGRRGVEVRSPKYRLSLPLPHPVDPDHCSADWDQGSGTLTLSLLLQREYDFLNF